MVIKLKNKVYVGFWAILFTFGLSGLLTAFAFGNDFVHRDYFHTPKFQSELDLFAQNLNMFELNNITFDQEKQLITVSEDEITNYRNGLGDIKNLISTLKGNYELRIDEAKAGNNPEAADIYKAERDKKIADITQIFKSDEYARAKVLSQKEAELKTYFMERVQDRTDFSRYKDQIQYYFSSSFTDKVYTNSSIDDDESGKGKMNVKNMLFWTSYSIPINLGQRSMNNSNPVNDRLAEAFIPFKGELAVSRDLSSSSSIMIEYHRYHEQQITLWVYAFASLVALILCIILRKQAFAIPPVMERWSIPYNKLPIDVRTFFLTLTSFVTLCLLFFIRDQFIYVFENPFVYGWNILFGITIASFLLVTSLIQGKIFAGYLKDWPYVMKEWEEGLLNKAGKHVKSIKRNLEDAFLDTSIGAQMTFLLIIVFVLGTAVKMVNRHPDSIFLYMVLLATIGLPIVLLLIIRIGDFNRIVIKTKELATGNLGPDLTVSGKSVLATLAGNINVLKQGVKSLQYEQAKSERLKTELITNVSHDLRTPLTSIITYYGAIETGKYIK